MENYDRLVEVQAAALNSEDAGLLQYSKTLDSLETKLTNIKTNFQQFYMEIINGPLVGGLIDIVNNLMSGLNKLGTWNGLMTLINVITGIKTSLKLLVKAFSGTAGDIYSNWKNMQNNWLVLAKKSGYERGYAEGQQYQQGLADSQSGVSNPPVAGTSNSSSNTNTKYTPSNKVKIGQVALSLGGAALSALSTRVAEDNQAAGQLLAMGGNAVSWAATGMQMGATVGHPIIGAVVGGIAGALVSLPDYIESLSPLAQAKERLEKAQKAEEEAKLEKAEKTSEANSLETTITNLKRLQAARYQSEDAEKEYIDACNEVAETYPELVTQIDSSGNKIIDIVVKATEAEEMLAAARLEAAEATEKAALATLYTKQQEKHTAEEKKTEALNTAHLNKNYYYASGDQVLTRQASLEQTGIPVSDDLKNLFNTFLEATTPQEEENALKNLNQSSEWRQLIEDLPKIHWYNRLFSWNGNAENIEAIQSIANTAANISRLDNNLQAAEEVLPLYSERVIQSSASSYYAQTKFGADTSFAKIASAETFLQKQAVQSLEKWANDSQKEIFTVTDDDQLVYTTSAQNELDQILNNATTRLQTLATDLGYHVEDFNTLISTADSQGISKTQFEKQLTKLGLDFTQDGAVKDYYDYYFGDNDSIFAASKEALKKDLASRFTDSESFNTRVDEAAIERLWGDLLDSIPPTLYSQVSLFVEKIQNQIKNGQIDSQQGISFVANYLDLWDALNDLNLDSETLAAAQQALASADLLSITGRAELKETLAELGVAVDKLSFERLESATVNLITEWGNLETKATSEIETLTDALTKAASGMDLKEAYQAMNKYGLEWSEFTFADGKYYLSENGISKMAAEWQNELINDLEDEQNRVSAIAKQIFQSQEDTLTLPNGETTLAGSGLGFSSEKIEALSNLKSLDEAAEFFGADSAEKLTDDQVKAYEFATTYWQGYQNWLNEIVAVVDGEGKTRTDLGIENSFDAYLSSLGQEIAEASQEVMDYYEAKNIHDAKIAVQQQKLKEEYLNNGEETELSVKQLYKKEQKVAAAQTIAKQGYGGYTEEEIATFATAFEVEATEIAERQADGTYRLQETFIKNIRSMGDVYENLLNNLIATSTESVLSSINGIATKIANGEKGFLSGYEDVQTNSYSEEDVKNLLKNNNGLEEEKYLDEVGKFINTILVSQGLDELEGEELIQASKELIASYNDSVNSNVSRFFELKQKELENTLTNVEKEELAGYSSGISGELYSIYKAYGFEITDNFITSAISLGEAALKAVQASMMTWEEAASQIEQEVEAGLLLKRYGNLGFTTNDSYSTYKEILESEGIFDSGLITSLTKMLTDEGINVSTQDIIDIFEWDNLLGEFVLKGGTDIPSIVKKWGVKEGTDLYHWLTESLTSAVSQKDISVAVKKENLGKTVSDSIGAALSGITNTSLSDLIDLYEEIHGENSFANSGLLDTYQKAVEQAQKGQIDSLVSILKRFAAEAQAVGANIDTSAIKDSFNTLLASLVQALSSGISGTLSNADFGSLISLIGGNATDYSSYITQTFNGIKISSEGALKIAGQFAKQYGNIPSIAETLINADYWDSYKDVDNLIQDIIKNSEKWGDESDEILSVLYKIRDAYSQISSDEAFDVLNFDALDGNADNYWKFAESIKSVAATLDAAFKGTSKMSYQQFYSMTSWIEQFNPGALEKTLGQTTTTLQQFFEAVEQTKKAGQVDLKAAATSLGIGFSDISDSIEGGIEDIAKEQIEYWTTYRDFLKSLKKLSEASKDLEIEIPSLESEGSEEAFKDRIEELRNLGYGDFLDSLADYFNIDWEHLSEENITNFMNAWNLFIRSVSGYSIEQLQSLWVKDANGKVSINWSQILTYEEADFSSLGTVDENALDEVLQRMGFQSNGDGTYTHEVTGFVAKISIGEDGKFGLDLTKVDGSHLSDDELLAVYDAMGLSNDTENGNLVYTDPNTGLTFSITNGRIVPDWENFEKKGLDALTLQSFFGGVWESSDDGKTYKATLGDGSEIYYNIVTGKITLNEPESSAIEDLSKDGVITLLNEAGYNNLTYSNGVITGYKDGGKITWDLNAGADIQVSDDEGNYNTITLEDLLNEVYGPGGWEGNSETGYTIKNSDGSVKYIIPVGYEEELTNTVQEVIAKLGETSEDGVEVEISADISAAQKAIDGLDGQQISIQCKLVTPQEDDWSFFDYENNPEIREVPSTPSKSQEENASKTTDRTTSKTKPGTYSSANLERGSRTITPVDNAQYGDYSGNSSPDSQSQGKDNNSQLLTREQALSMMVNPQQNENYQISLKNQMKELEDQMVKACEAILFLQENGIDKIAETFPKTPDADLWNQAVSRYAELQAEYINLEKELAYLENQSENDNTNEEIEQVKEQVNSQGEQVKQEVGQTNSILSSILSKIGTLNTTVYVSTGGGTMGATYKEYSANGGNALASGNATKTLVGELGPELAVYDNEYHLLGQNGAEFTDLPSNAIVFNHKQTEDLLKGKSGVRGKALANGNVSGPAYAGSSNIDAAIAQADKIIKLWSDILNTSLDDMLASNSGGGGGAQANIEELQEWYNLSRKIANVEQEINNLIAERENIATRNGAAYLRSLREEQNLLNQQAATQKLLLDYQALQLKRQADEINTNKIWSQFLTVGEDGLLQYIEGNETNGGKGALQVLQELNKMSSSDQEKFIKSLGYSYTNTDGKTLSGSDLVKQFYQDIQDQIDQYDSLYDTVHETEEKLQELASSIEEVNTEIRENKLELEQNIYDTLTSAWEAEISELKEQKELIEKANQAYTDGLSKALQAERDLYSQSQSTSDREKLQRQLSLLRRSGGSASQISSLEEQIDSLLKEEYFNKQQQMIEDITEANEEQSRLMEQQVQLQEDALEYQKENGVLWTKVYEIMGGSFDSILAFMQGKSTEFFSKSTEQQEDMLIEWSKKIGIYTEDRQYQNHVSAASSIWDNIDWGEIPESQLANLQEVFAQTYAESMMSGLSTSDASTAAEEKVRDLIGKQAGSANSGTTNDSSSSASSSSNSEQKYWRFTYGGKEYRRHWSTKESAIKAIDELYQADINDLTKNPGRKYDEKFEQWRKKAIASLVYDVHTYSKGYSSGGLVDYTGIALVHGSKSKPESFLNANQTEQIKQALQVAYGQNEPLAGLRDVISQMRSLIGNLTTTNNSANYDVSVAPGAVVINVDNLADGYDVEELSADIMNHIADVATKTISRSVNRR